MAENLPYLPTEIHHHILSFVPCSKMDNVKYVSKDFYAVCSAKLNRANRFKYLNIDIQMLEDESIVDSMAFSLRRFTRMSIKIDNFAPLHLQRLRSVLQNLGRSVKRLFINAMGKSVKFYQSTLISWLNLMPNLKYISTGGLYSCEEILDDPHTQLNLKKLKIAQLCPISLSSKLHIIPNSSLQWVQFNDKVPVPNLEEVFKKHSDTLDRLDLFRTVYTDPAPFRHLKLRELNCLYQEYMNNNFHDRFLRDIIEHQTNLNKLTLGECDLCSNCYPVSSELLRKICSKGRFKELSFGLSHLVTSMDMWELRKLTQLEELTIQMYFDTYVVPNTVEMLETLCSTKLSSLKSLRLLTSCNAPVSLNNFLDSFENLRTLELSESFYTFSAGKSYSTMTSLNLLSEQFQPIDIHPSLIKSMPNLDELRVSPMFPRVSTFRAVFKSKINCVEITVFPEENVSLNKMRKIRKLCKKIEKRIEDNCGEYEINFADDDHEHVEDDF